jgi:hypothetical protein
MRQKFDDANAINQPVTLIAIRANNPKIRLVPRNMAARLDMTHFSPTALKKSLSPNQQAQAAQARSPKPTPTTVATNSLPSLTPPQATPH